MWATFVKALRTLALFVISISLVTGCAPGNPVSIETTTPTPTVEPEVLRYPLTGLVVTAQDTDNISKPVVIGKLDNSADARPQEGLNSADIVFEVLVEGGITRFAGIWHSTFPKRIGPIRSVRPMDPDIASPFGGIIVYSGGQVRFVKKMRATELYNASETSEQSKKTMVRIKTRHAPHNLFLLPEKIQSQHLKMTGPAVWQDFTDDESKVSTATGVPAAKATARFPATKVVWTYNPTTSKFERTQDGKKATDAATKARIATENLILIYVDIDRSEPDPVYGNVPRTEVNGKGTGFYLNDGKSIPITWTKKDRKAMHEFWDASGTKITLAAGNTWVELVPTDRKGKITIG